MSPPWNTVVVEDSELPGRPRPLSARTTSSFTTAQFIRRMSGADVHVRTTVVEADASCMHLMHVNQVLRSGGNYYPLPKTSRKACSVHTCVLITPLVAKACPNPVRQCALVFQWKLNSLSPRITPTDFKFGELEKKALDSCSVIQ
jgi:hypothetical protein